MGLRSGRSKRSEAAGLHGSQVPSEPGTDTTDDRGMVCWVLARARQAPAGAAMTDKIGNCIAKIVAIGRGAGTLQERLAEVERLIADLVRDATSQAGGDFKVLQDLRDRLGQELNLHHGRVREFLDPVIDYVDMLLDRD